MRSLWLAVIFTSVVLGMSGCATVRTSPDARQVEARELKADPALRNVADAVRHDESRLPIASPAVEPATGVAQDLSEAQPLDVLLARALERNPTVQAARFNVLALQHRIPQVTALEDPILSNTIFPIPSVAPQYSLMGYMPYAVLLAQQFPWCGTLRLRGMAAEDDVRIALQELAAAQLDVAAGVKRAYHDLHFNERALALLDQNRGLAQDFLKIARQRYSLATATQADVLRAEVAVSDIDRERETTRQALVEARSELARLLHVDPDTPLQTVPDLPVEAVPRELQRLAQLASASRPELQGTARRDRPRPEGRRAGPETLLSEPHRRPGLSGHGEDQRHDPGDGHGPAERRVLRGHEPARLSQEAGGGRARGRGPRGGRRQALRGRTRPGPPGRQGPVHAGHGAAECPVLAPPEQPAGGQTHPRADGERLSGGGRGRRLPQPDRRLARAAPGPVAGRPDGIGARQGPGVARAGRRGPAQRASARSWRGRHRRAGQARTTDLGQPVRPERRNHETAMAFRPEM